MTDTGQRTAEFLALVIENAELRQILVKIQDQRVGRAVETGEECILGRGATESDDRQLPEALSRSGLFGNGVTEEALMLSRQPEP